MKKLNAALALALILQTLAGALPVQAAEAPPLPSSFYGTVTLDGADVPAGTPVTAWVRGVQVAQAPSRTTDGDSVYVIDVPADDPATPQIEGGREGQAVLFKVDGYAAGQLGTWRSGVVAELNLAAVGHDGPDLAVVKDNGETEVYAGQPLTYTLTVVNVGRQGATGVSVVDTLPDHVTFVAAGEGGSEAGGVVTWPAFDLDVDGIAERTVVVEVGDPLAAGVNVITNTVSVADDGAGGADPTPVNNTAVDADAVAAAPALAVSTRELLLCAPDDPVLPSLSSFLISSVQEVEYSCGAGELSTGARDRLASAARALGRAFEDDPLVTGSDDLLALGDAIGAHITCDAALFSDLSELQVAVADLQDQVCGVAHHGVSAAFQPGSTFTLVGRPVTVTLFLQNRGTDLMAYTVNLQSPISTSSTPFTVTLDAGQTFTAPVVATPMEVGNFTLVADVQAVGQDGILSYAPHTQATAALRGLDAYLEVVEVSAQPVFIEHASGTTATLHARIANLTQAPISGRARTRVWDSAGSPVFTATRLLRFESALLDVQYDLGTLDTAGLERGFYTVTLEVIGADDTLFPEGDTIPRGAGWGLLGVGQAVEARSWVDADVVVPGNPTVGTYIETELVAYEEPLSMTVDLDRAVFTAEAGSGVVGSTPAKCALCAGGPTLAAPSVPLVVDSLPATVEEPVGIAPGVVLDMDAAPVQQSAWPYTKTVAVYNPGTSALTDYQVRLDVPYLTGMNADFSDVRFKADPAGDFLPYWTESYSESVSAVTWVKVDSLPAQSITELIVYYGDPTAVDESDGGSVFEFFDDFEGSAIDGGKWSVIGSADRLVVSDGYLDLTVADNSGVSGEIVNGIRAHSSYTVGHSILGRVRDPDGSPDNHISYVGMTTLPACHTFWNCSQKGLTIYQNTDYDFLSNSRDTSQEYTENNYGSISDWHTYRIDYAGGSLARFYRDDELRSMHTADDVIPDIDSLYPAIGGNDYSNRDPHMYYDWILVRQYADPEPIVVVSSDDIVIDEDTTWDAGIYHVRNLTVTNSANLILSSRIDADNDYADDYGITIYAENVVVEEGASIIADGQGYAGGMGPGVGGASSAGGGGGYGGRGGVSNSGGVGGAVYGSIYRPTHLGSSGGIPSDGAPGAGGGAVHLVVSDTLTVDGIISANGAASYRRGGGGSGGSIWVEVETLVTTGSGERLIRANGGRGNEHYGRGGGGSGGRVAVYAADVDAFQAAGGQIEARGGSSNHQWGGAGTVYLYEEGQNVLGDLVVKNGANEGTETELEPGSWEFDTIEMAEYGHLRVVSRTSVLTLANNTLVTDSTSRLTSEGAVIVPASFDVVSMTLNVQGELLGAEDIAITLDSHLILHAGPYPLGTLALGDVTVNGTLTLASYDNDDAIYDDGSDYGFTLHADNLTIGASGVVEADGLGHLLNNGLGTHADGAGHAGYGGGEAPIYGSPYTPVTLGSSGDGGRGGGAIHLVISDTLQVEGALQANGVSDGSGGSLWVQTALLTGTGHIAADGGDQAGGGGYIAIYAGDSVGYTGTFGVAFGHGGVACPVAGKCDGVVYRDDVDPYASTIDVSPDELVADGIGTGIITVTLKTIDGTPMPYKGVEVRISPENAGVFIAGQSAIDYVPIGTTDTSGMVTTVITSTVPGARTVEARTVEGEVVEQTATVTFTVGDVDEDASLVETDETTLWASGEDEATVTATLVDGYDHPVSGKVVLIQSTGVVTLTQALTTTDAQGQVQATVRSTEVQTVTVTAFDQTDDITLTQQVTLSFIAGPVDPVHSTVTVTPTILVAGVQTATVEAVLLDELDRPVVGREVELVVGGSGNTITPDPGIADGSGRVTFLLASTGAGIKDVSVQSDGVVVDGGQVLFVNDVPDADESKVTVSPSRVAADGVQTATVSVVVNDEYGNPVAGVPVTLSHDGATLPVTLTQPSALTDEDGLATGSIACARAGQVTVSAAVMEMPIFDTATVTFEGADLDVLGTSGPQKVIAGGVMTVTISVANVGRVVAEDVILTATLAADVSDIVVGGTHPFTQTGHVVVWQLDEMAAGEGIDVPVRVTAPGASATLETWVEARSSTEEEQLSNNVDSISTTVVGAELDVQKSASPVNVVVDYPVTYTIHLENQGWTTATSVVLTDTLPQHLHFVTHTAPYPFTQDGRLLTWQVGDLPAGADVDFEVVATVGDTAPLDAVLVNRVEATSEAALDDEDAASVTIKAGYRFDAWLQPAEATTSVGAPTTYRIRVRNTGTMPDDYAVALDGLDSPWYTLEPATLHLPAGATGEALVTVLVSGCAYTGTHPFEVEVTGVTRGVKETLDGTLNLHAEPFISGLSPANSAKLGSTSALFAWTTNVTATTSLLIRPDDGISPYTEVTGASGTSHSVLVEGLDRNTTYLWKVRSQSACGVEESGERALTIGNGLVFAPCTYDFTVDRDYDQRVTMQVRNDDLVSHTLLLTIEVSTEDLIVGFIGSGSVDEEVTLMPGEKRDVTLAIHAQDAQPNGEYDLVAHLVADEGGDPIVDYADVHVTVFVPVVEFEMAVLEYNPETLVHTVVVTNNSNFALTDLDVTYEVLSGTGEVFVNPAMEHVYLPEGASREFDVIPMPGQDFDGMQVELTALAAGAERSATLDVACLEGCNVLEGQAENVMMEARSASGYCTNNPTVRTYIDLPSGFRRENVANATLRFSARWRWHFWAREHPRPHNVHIYINGHHTGSLTDTIPIGIYTFEVDPAFLNETAVGVSRNEIVLITEHLNGGHYIMATDLALSICLDEYTEMVCAADQAQADGIVAGRSYLIPAAEEITTRILEPGDGAGVPFGSEILVSAWITDSLASDHYYTVIGYSDNNSGSLILHDDGRHGDGAAHDGVYANTWTPLRPGQTVLSVAAGNCDCTGSDSVILDVYTSDARLDLAHSVPVTGVSVLEETFSYPPLTSTVGGQDVTYDWSYELTPTNRSRTTYFQSTLPDMRPGEVRQVAAATVVSYTTPGGHGEVTLPPLYVKAANLTAIAPSLYTANPGGEAYYDVTLYNPQSTSDVFTLTLDGLPTDWIVDSHIVPVEAGATVVVPVAVPVPAGAELGDYAFAVTVETGSGGRDSATAQLEVIDLVQVDVEPSLLAADNGETVTYTLTITNLENADRTYTLAVEGLEGNAVDLLETLDVGAASAVTTTMRVTAWAPKGVYAFRVTASHQSSEQNAQASGEAALAVLSELGVEVALDPAEATGGRGSPAAYTVSITNIGSLADTYDLAVSVPDGWTADLSANGAQVSEITLTPYVFNEASLQLLVIPAEDASPDDYAFEFVATSQTDPGIQAAITGTILVSRRGVTVQIAPHSTTMDPTGTHTWDVTVRNTGEWQDTFDLEISGIVSGTAQFDVNPVTLSPGESTVVQMTAGPLPFALPQTYPFGVTARSQGNPEIIGYDVAEITFEGFEAVDVGILPATQTVTDTLSASFLVVITNTGNIDTVYALSASSDPALDLALEVDEIYIPPHMAAGILLTAQADDSGTYDIAVQADSVSSSASDMGSATLTIVITNKAPVATDDDVATDEDVAVTIDVLANDSDPDDDDLSIDSVTQGTHGSVVNNGTDVTYTPDTDYNGTDSFTYVVTDGVLTDTATVTVTVSPVNDAPVAMSDSATTGEDTAVTVDVLDNDDDADGDSLSIDSVTQPMSGTVVITFEDLVLYTPDPDACGGDSFTYVATDGTLTDTATVDVAVICVPDAPVAIDDSAATDEDAPVTIDVLDNDSDVDGDSLMVDSVTQPAHGTVTNNGTDVTYTPGVNYCGSDSFSYVVTDGTLPDSATVDVTVTCVPDTPVANDDTATTDEDAAVIVDVLANDGDVDGDSLGIDSVTQGSHGSVVVVALEELAMYTPDEDYCGGDSFSYVVTDGVLTDTAVVDVTVTCVNDAPVADNDSATTEEDTAGIIDVLANDSDADGDPLSVDSVTRPANGTVANNGTDLTYTPETDYCGGDSFAYVVTDGVLTDTATVDVTVVCVPDTPVANDDTATMDEDTTATIDVLANDEDADGDPLAVDSVTQGSHGSVVNNGIDVTYTPDIGYTGPDTFTYVVTDGVLTDTAVVSVTVTPIVITCELYPIALHIETLNGVQVGEEMEDIYNGGGPGNFGWLSWTGDPSVPTLVQSLTPPGDSDTYVNPYDPVDHILTTNDWVYGKPGVSNSKNVRDALDTLKAYTITVPVWQEATGEGNHLKYRVVGFAQIRITDYRLSGTDRISAIFLGYTTCGDGGPNVAPLVQVGPDQVADEGDPVTFEGSFTDPDVGDAHQFLWDFGDGTTEAGVPDAGRILTTTHVYTTSGVYAVTLTVLDNHGGVGIDSLQVTVDEGTPALACLHASESIDIRDRVVIAADVCGGGYLELGADARVEGDVVVDGDAFLRSRARVTGDMTLAGSLRKQTDVVIEGSLEEGATVALPDIPVKDVPYGSRNVTVKNGKHETWAPGDYKDGMVRARGSVVLTAGTYNFRKLQIEPDAELILDTTGGEIVVNVDGQLEFGDRSLISTQGDGTVTFYTNGTGTLRIGTDVTFRGAIVAPYAEVHVFSRTQVNCCIAARRIVIEPDTTLRPFRGGTPAVGWPTSVVATKGSRDLLAKVGMNVGYLSMMMVVGLFLGKNGARRKKRG